MRKKLLSLLLVGLAMLPAMAQTSEASASERGTLQRKSCFAPLTVEETYRPAARLDAGLRNGACTMWTDSLARPSSVVFTRDAAMMRSAKMQPQLNTSFGYCNYAAPSPKEWVIDSLFDAFIATLFDLPWEGYR